MPTLRKFGKHVSIWQQRTGPVMHCRSKSRIWLENTDEVLRPRPPSPDGARGGGVGATLHYSLSGWQPATFYLSLHLSFPPPPLSCFFVLVSRILDRWNLNEGIDNHLTLMVPGNRFLVIRYGTVTIGLQKLFSCRNRQHEASVCVQFELSHTLIPTRATPTDLTSDVTDSHQLTFLDGY